MSRYFWTAAAVALALSRENSFADYAFCSVYSRASFASLPAAPRSAAPNVGNSDCWDAPSVWHRAAKRDTSIRGTGGPGNVRFTTLKRSGIQAIAGATAPFNLAMQIAGSTTQVEVTETGAVTDPDRTDLGTTLDNNATRNLPLVSRNPDNFIFFQPNVGGVANTEFGIPRKIGANGFNGRIDYEIDGGNETESDRAGIRLIPISNTYVEEVQEVSNGFAPEFRNTVGTVFNTITESGTNDYNGEGGFMFRRTPFSARPKLPQASRPTPDVNADSYSADGGGWLVRDKLFFFGAVEHVERDLPTQIYRKSARLADKVVGGAMLRKHAMWWQSCCRQRRSVCLALVLFLFGGLSATLNAQVRPRITRSVDNANLVHLPNTTHPAVALARDLGRAAPDLQMDRLLLQLQSSPQQEAALQQLIAEQQDPSSPRYHAWLTPQEFGEHFGPSQEDIDTITGWLQSQGLQVSEIPTGRRSIEFGGTARQVEDAFRTEMHQYLWNGIRHLSNASDISVPEALAPVVGGIVSLHDFHSRSMHHVIQQGVSLSPYSNFTSGARGVSPFDFAVIYNVSALWAANYDGTGQKIAVVGETNIRVSDVTGFRSLFGLPVNNPQIIVNGKDPGIVSSAAETEADLDVEWAGAVAKGATIEFVVSGSTASSDGVTLSAQYIVNNNLAPVMTVSFGLCEGQMGSANQFFYNLWEQAAAQGISVFVASGDSGSAGCDVPYSAGTPAHLGLGVNGLASTPFNVAVGGTQFNDSTSPSTYWNSSNDAHYASARGYIPETAWNESSFSAPCASGNSLWASGGGVSILWLRPIWQTGAGVPAGPTRVLPDVSLTAAGHDGYVIEQEGSLYLVGGTSASTPAFAGIMAIVNQFTAARNGNPNGKFYALATRNPSVYHDITSGGNAVPCLGGSASCSASLPDGNIGQMKGYRAAAGFDLATGWGSVDAYSLAVNWDDTPVAPTIISLSPNPMTAPPSIQNLSINGAGFSAGSGLEVKVGAATYSGTQVTFMNSSLLVVAISASAAAQTLAVQVTNPNGQSTNPVNLQVSASALPPTVNSLTPNLPRFCSTSSRRSAIRRSQ